MDMNSFVKAVHDRYCSVDDLSLLKYTDDFLLLLGNVLSENVRVALDQQESSYKFLNFWTIIWPNSSEFLASCSSTTSARQLSERFEKNNREANDELAEYFYDVLSRPPSYLNLLLNIEDEARKNKHAPSELEVGKNVAFIFKCVFKTLFFEVYGNNKKVSIYGLGTFERSLKIGANTAKKSGNVGYLQFMPDLP